MSSSLRSLSLLLAVVLVLGTPGCGGKTDAAERHLRLAARYLAAHKQKEAKAEIDAAISSAPAKVDTYHTAIALYTVSELSREAARIAELALGARRRSKLDRQLTREELAYLHLTVGTGLQRSRDLVGAERAYKDALALAPSSPQLLNSLGYFYAEENIHLDQALKLTRHAARLAPDDGNIVDSLGWTQFKLGDYDLAIATLKRAVELSPDQAEIRYHLAAACAKSSRNAEARVELHKALLLNGELAEARKLLRSLHR